jgi:hypothetical protein
MINVTTATKNLLKSGSTISTSAGATIEYNLNSMVGYIKATSPTSTSTPYTAAYKKLFPIDTIYKPFRPVSPGIKYLVYTTGNTDTPLKSFEDPRDVELGTKPRLYYPGPDTVYKYWLSPKNDDISVSLEYLSDDTVTGVSRLIPTNKIVARFETNHDKPTSWTISGVTENNTIRSVTGTTLNSNGEALIYFNGSTWSTTEPTTYTTTEYLKSITLTAVNSKTGKLIGVIEFSPRWVIPVDSDVVSLTVNKETTSDDTSIVPVGLITANYLNLAITKHHTSSRSIIEFNPTGPIDRTKIYLVKNAIIKPYINIGDGSSTEKVIQGTFYINGWSLSEFGDASIDATDAAKILQDTVCPQLLVQDSPITSIIKRILDSVGFSNYKINVKNVSSKVDDDSIPSLSYWWSDGDKTVWDVLQELCRDIQMNAFVDENNILNFYSRNYIYDKNAESKWTFTSEEMKTGGVVTYSPNIINLNTKEMFSANQVRVRYSTAFMATNSQSSSPLWKASESFLGAGSLAKPIVDSSTMFQLNPNTVNSNRTDKILDAFSGYVLINGEILEYDGVWYQYVPLVGSTPVRVLIKSQTDIWKNSVLAKPGYKNFTPTGEYNIKNRGALGTSKTNHSIAPDSYINKVINEDPTKFNQYNVTLATPDLAKEIAGIGTYKIQSNLENINPVKGFLSVSNLDKDKKTFTVAIKGFNSINTSSSYFAFGTRMFFDSQVNTQQQVGGIGFCLDETGKNGYYVLIRTTAYAGLQKDIMIVKLKNNKLTVLKDSQQTSNRTMAGLYAATAYNIDVLVKKESDKNTINLYVNGFKIVATDYADILDYPPFTVTPTVAISKNVGMHCGQGVAYFEYLYAKDVDDKFYKQKTQLASYEYNGVYSDDTLSMLYGDIIYNDGDTPASQSGGMFEFGTTAREIKKTKISYDDRPAIPIMFRTSLNKYVTVLDQRLQPFGAESYVLNNTSTTVALDNGDNTSFYVLGNSIQRSGVIDYDTKQNEDPTNKESVIFDSSWIQNEEDAKSLAEWIKSNVLNKGRLVDLSVFGNPIISAGDIVTINYPILGITTDSAKYIVTKCSIEYREGLTTSVSCRAI